MSETRDIVILGASFGGMGIAHNLLKNTIPELNKAQSSNPYRIVLIDQSSHFFWRIGAPRAAVSTALIPHSETFTPVTEGFKQYAPEIFSFRQGRIESIDTTARTISIAPPSGSTESLSYYALIIATGSLTPTPLTSLVGDYDATKSALDVMNKRIASATSVVVSGGGPVGVETAGEIGEALNGAAGWFASRPANPKAKITLVTGGKKLIPILRQSLSEKAEKFLNRVGVDVVYEKRVERVTEPDKEGGKTSVHLSDGSILECDVYIPGTGTVPNSSFLPRSVLDEKNFVKTDLHLRVPDAGDRVYCIGDVGNHTRGGVLNIKASVPILTANIAKDLGSVTGAEKTFTPDTSESQVVPVGRNKGVGAFKGFVTPSIMVWGIKGRDYMLSMKAQTTHGA